MAIDLVPQGPRDHVVFAASSLSLALDVATGVTGLDVQVGKCCDKVSCGKWHITNKYYTADVHVVVVDSLDVLQSLWHRVDGFIFVIDQDSGETVDSVEPFMKGATNAIEAQPEVKFICAVGSIPRDETAVTVARRWCHDKGFEYCPVGGIEDRVEEDGEQLGRFRVREALHANMWATLVMNDTQGPRSDVSQGTSHGTLSNNHVREGYSKESTEDEEDKSGSDTERAGEKPLGVQGMSTAARALIKDLDLAALARHDDDADTDENDGSGDDDELMRVMAKLQTLQGSLSTLCKEDRFDVAEHVATTLAKLAGVPDDEL